MQFDTYIYMHVLFKPVLFLNM